MSDAEFSPPKGSPPTVCWLARESLLIDATYQRSIDSRASAKLTRHIAENWDWRLCAPLTVSHRQDGEAPGHYVIDGQHRLAAAELRGDIAELPCIVSNFQTFEEEAMCFVELNSARKAVTALDRYHARVAAKEPLALKIKRVVEEAAFTVARNPDAAAWKPGELAFPDRIGKVLEAEGRAYPYGAAAFALAAMKVWADKPLLRGADLFGGLLTIKRWWKGPIEPLLDHLVLHQPGAIVRRASQYAAEHEVSLDYAIGKIMLQGFNGAPERERNLLAATPLPGDIAGGIWCDQCDKMVSPSVAAACRSQWCKAKAAA